MVRQGIPNKTLQPLKRGRTRGWPSAMLRFGLAELGSLTGLEPIVTAYPAARRFLARIRNLFSIIPPWSPFSNFGVRGKFENPHGDLVTWGRGCVSNPTS